METPSKATSLAHELMSLLEKGGRVSNHNWGEMGASNCKPRFSYLLGWRWEFCGASKKMSSNLKYLNPTNQPLNEVSCQLSVTFTILWVSSVRLCCVGCAKKIMQCQLGWDDRVPESELAHWERWKSELSVICYCASTYTEMPFPATRRSERNLSSPFLRSVRWGLWHVLLSAVRQRGWFNSVLLSDWQVKGDASETEELQATTLSVKIY